MHAHMHVQKQHMCVVNTIITVHECALYDTQTFVNPVPPYHMNCTHVFFYVIGNNTISKLRPDMYVTGPGKISLIYM